MIIEGYIEKGVVLSMEDGIKPSEILAFEKGLDLSKLTKKIIIDKNGHKVTKWVKTDAVIPKEDLHTKDKLRIPIEWDDYKEERQRRVMSIFKDFQSNAEMYKDAIDDIPLTGLIHDSDLARKIKHTFYGFSVMYQKIAATKVGALMGAGENKRIAVSDIPADVLAEHKQNKKLGNQFLKYGHDFAATRKEFSEESREGREINKRKVATAKEKLKEAVDYFTENSKYLKPGNFWVDSPARFPNKYYDLNSGLIDLAMGHLYDITKPKPKKEKVSESRQLSRDNVIEIG